MHVAVEYFVVLRKNISAISNRFSKVLWEHQNHLMAIIRRSWISANIDSFGLLTLVRIMTFFMRNIAIDYRYGASDLGLINQYANELVGLPPSCWPSQCLLSKQTCPFVSVLKPYAKQNRYHLDAFFGQRA